jgi:2-polyprenyl-6-methoxyphenol hydroxylase-like FAD-dependent oxidoreductase
VDVTDRDDARNGERVDVLVVGAGPTGLALAAQLHEFKAPFRIIDRGQDRVHESRALAVQPRSMEVLARYGVTERLVQQGSRGIRLRIHTGNRTIAVSLFDIGIDDTAYPYLLWVSQAVTEQVLVEHLAEHRVTVERGAELVGLHQSDGDVACLVRHAGGADELVRARYVVGCDGAHSTVRELAGIEFEGLSYPQTFVLADVEADGIQVGEAHAFLAPRGLLFFFPLGAPATWRVRTSGTSR